MMHIVTDTDLIAPCEKPGSIYDGGANGNGADLIAPFP
jgi:hypothetical protein